MCDYIAATKCIGNLTHRETGIAHMNHHGRFRRFTGANRERNQEVIEALQKLATEKGVSASQLALAWVLAKGSTIVPVIGARTRAQLTESLAALDVLLSPEDLARIEKAIPPSAAAGSRYGEDQMQVLDSER